MSEGLLMQAIKALKGRPAVIDKAVNKGKGSKPKSKTQKEIDDEIRRKRAARKKAAALQL